MCMDGSGYWVEDVDGECPVCGEPTVGGDAVERCQWSPVVCSYCGHAPCDGSC